MPLATRRPTITRAALAAGLVLLALDARAQAVGQATGQKPAARPAPAGEAPAIGCPSLANLRFVLRAAQGDRAAVTARLADPKADHLGCAAIPRERAVALGEHITLGGDAYDCVEIQGTSACHWVVAGTLVPPAPPERRAAPRGSADKAAPERPAGERKGR
ncbi:hypothetical protein [Methylobacterium sp. A54F]